MEMEAAAEVEIMVEAMEIRIPITLVPTGGVIKHFHTFLNET